MYYDIAGKYFINEGGEYIYKILGDSGQERIYYYLSVKDDFMDNYSLSFNKLDVLNDKDPEKIKVYDYNTDSIVILIPTTKEQFDKVMSTILQKIEKEN